MDQVFRASFYSLMILLLILSVFHENESNLSINDRGWSFNRNLKRNSLVANKNKDGFKRRLQHEMNNVHNNPIITECCPSVEELIQPRGGVSKDGRILELYRDENSTQIFHQVSCREKGKICGRINYKNHFPAFHCVQKYTYTYALVREFSAPEILPWRLDYIRIRNGCSCERIKT